MIATVGKEGARSDLDTSLCPLDVDDWELVTQVQAGTSDAFGLLYKGHVDAVFGYIYRRVHNKAVAEDLTSETFLRAFQGIGDISYQGRDIGAWFTRIARNLVFDHLKSARHRLETAIGDVVERKEAELSAEVTVISWLTSKSLISAVKRLDQPQRDCIVLRFIQRMSVRETGAILGKSDAAVKSLQRRAVCKLADLIDGEVR